MFQKHIDLNFENFEGDFDTKDILIYLDQTTTMKKLKCIVNLSIQKNKKNSTQCPLNVVQVQDSVHKVSKKIETWEENCDITSPSTINQQTQNLASPIVKEYDTTNELTVDVDDLMVACTQSE